MQEYRNTEIQDFKECRNTGTQKYRILRNAGIQEYKSKRIQEYINRQDTGIFTLHSLQKSVIQNCLSC